MSIKENLEKVRKTIPKSVCLVAVSKTKPVEKLQEAYDAGQRIFGENKAREMEIKHPLLPKDIQWHFIGHLQTNKVKYIAPFVSLIESIDSLKLLKEVNKQAIRNERTIRCLLQFHIAEEESKFGLDMEEIREMLLSEEFSVLKNISICGVMGMATFVYNEDQLHKEFAQLKSIFDTVKSEFYAEDDNFSIISMGMSGDYELAIEEGSNMVRIGTAIFGERG